MAILRAPPAKTATATRTGTELAITGLEPTARPSRCRPNAMGTGPALPPLLRPPSGQQSASCLGDSVVVDRVADGHRALLSDGEDSFPKLVPDSRWACASAARW